MSAHQGKENPSYKHGMVKSSGYKTWNNMLSRCSNANHPRYKDWGGRNIKVAKDWLNFKNFYRDMGDKPSPKHTLERRDNDLGYSKYNCYWATTKEQSANRRSNVHIYYEGSFLIPRDFADKINLPKATVYSRLNRGWTTIEIQEGKRTTTPRFWRILAFHEEGKHSRSCE